MTSEMGTEKTAEIPAEEIAELFRKAIAGRASMCVVGPSWDQVYCGNVEFKLEGYKVVVFNDCCEFDYVDHAVAPDGRITMFSEWTNDPVDLLTSRELGEIELLAETAPPVAEREP